MLRKLFWLTLFLALLGALAGASFLGWGYFYITRDLPRLSTIEDYRPSGVTRVFSSDGTLIAEFFRERRYPVKLSEVPEMVRNAFLAAEDASFYKHPGIDPISILRATIKNLQTGTAKQGGSTITQQVVKNLLLTPEKNIKRKIKEAILSYRLEQKFTKDEILEIYLNEIFFGNTAYGIKAAAHTYFHKSLDQLTLAEAALLAGLPKAPSRYSPLSNLEQSKRRQRYVLNQMVRAGFVSQEEANQALDTKIEVFPASFTNIYHAPYYVSEVRRVFNERWHEMDVDTDSLVIRTNLDLQATSLAISALRRGLREVDKRRGWRGPIGRVSKDDEPAFLEKLAKSLPDKIEPEVVYPALVVSNHRGALSVNLGSFAGVLSLKSAEWANKRLTTDDRATIVRVDGSIRPGDVVEVVLASSMGNDPISIGDPRANALQLSLDQTPEIEGAIALMDPHSGKVLTTVGGYSYQKSVFNRATQSYRQPGSTFKPLVYLAAVDGYKYTPATIVYDIPRTFRVGDEFWTPGNFDKGYLGPITLRVALEKSRNLVSADIVSRIGVDAPIRYAQRLGIESRLGRNLSISLGSSEVTLFELTRAYGVFAAKGLLVESNFINRIEDRTGKVIYDWEEEKLTRAKQVIEENVAFVMANMMKGVVESGTGYRVKELGRPVAGKTGTSNNQMDAWFVGYTPSLVAGVWVGFDIKRDIGNKETGGRVAAPIWLDFMRDYLAHIDQEKYEALEIAAQEEAKRLAIEYVPPPKLVPEDFPVPETVEGFWVDKRSGLRSTAGAPGAIYEYFIKGTAPSESAAESMEDEYFDGDGMLIEESRGDPSSYLDSGEL